MLKSLQCLLSADAGAGTLLMGASRLGFLPDKYSFLVRGLQKAPPPPDTKLSGDWFKNLDILSDGLGCVLCGVFDSLVEGLTLEEISQVDIEDVEDLLPEQPIIRQLMVSSFDVCRELYVRYGDLTDAAKAGKFNPGGIVVQAGIQPLMNKAGANPAGRSPLLGKTKKVTSKAHSGQKGTNVL